MEQKTLMIAKKCESFIYDFFNRNKDTMCVRFSDTHDTFQGRGRGIILRRSPSDFVVSDIDRGMRYAEVKSTSNPKGTTKALFSQQWAIMQRAVRAGASYFYYIYSTERRSWYEVPAKTILANNGNVEWDDLSPRNQLNNAWKNLHNRV